MSLERHDGSRRAPAPMKPQAPARHTSPHPTGRRMPLRDRVHFKDGQIVEPPIGAVIQISGQLHHSQGIAVGKVYDYAAIRANNGRWYTTGASCPPRGYSWPMFLQFLESFIDPIGERLK